MRVEFSQCAVGAGTKLLTPVTLLKSQECLPVVYQDSLHCEHHRSIKTTKLKPSRKSKEPLKVTCAEGPNQTSDSPFSSSYERPTILLSSMKGIVYCTVPSRTIKLWLHPCCASRQGIF